MEDIMFIRRKIERLYQTNPNIHICVKQLRPKLIVESSPAKIVGVYKNIFQIEETESRKLPTRHIFQYGDVVVGQVVIEELNYVPSIPIKNK